jgi:hypothetical protein
MNKRAALMVFVGVTLASTAGAATQPDATSQKILDDVRALAEKARREGAADRWVLQGMDDLVRKYSWPWRHSVVDEKFSDGNYTSNPVWEPVTGKFWVDRSLGLRSRAVATAAAPANREKDKQKFKDALRDAVLAEMTGQRPGSTGAAPASTTVAEIYLRTKITNSFALDVSFSPHQPPSDPGVIEFGVFEGTRRDRGYVLAIVTGEENYAELQRITAKGVAIVDREVLPEAPDTGDVQKISLRREANGAMTVTLNDKSLIQTQDNGIKSAFQSFGITNRVGDFAVRQVTILDSGS